MNAFPLAAAPLLPHAGMMCCIDRLLAASPTSAEADALLVPGHALLHGDRLDPAGCVELAAQTAGAMQGYERQQRGLPPQSGFLVGVQNFCISGTARTGDRIRIAVSTLGQLGEVSVLEARLHCGGTLLAEGKLKVFTTD